MDDEAKGLLKESLEIERENNKLLTKIYRHIRFSRYVAVVYWIVIIGSVFGIFYFVRPYIDAIVGAQEDVQGVFKSFGDYFPQ